MEKQIESKAFTLIEMLTVIVIIGIILAIAIPNVSKIISNRNKKLYNAHMQIVEKATQLYIDQNKAQLLNSNSICLKVNYDKLIKSELITESSIKCNGFIVMNKTGNNKDLIPSYYLNCIDKDNNSVSNNNVNIPSNCIEFND